MRGNTMSHPANRGDLGGGAIRDRSGRSGNLRCHGAAWGEVPAFHRVDRDVLRRASECSRKGNRFGEAEPVRGGGEKPRRQVLSR